MSDSGPPLECILCEDPLTAANETDEHIIPNALGGTLTTRRATCSTCNSKSGDTIDAKLVDVLQPFAVQLNVTRDRGSHPEITVPDALTGRKLILRPGQPALFDEGLRVTEPEQFADEQGNVVQRRKYSFSAPTREKAEERVRRLSRSKRRKLVAISELKSEERSGESYTYNVSLETGDPEIRRAVMKIALCFAREQGFRLGPAAIGCAFLKGTHTPLTPFGVPNRDVVTFKDFPTAESTPLHHGVFLKRSGSLLLAYVTLFSLCEFVLLLDERCEDRAFGHPIGYFRNLEVDWDEPREFEWVLPDAEFLSRLGNYELPTPQRYQSRGVSFSRHMANPQGHAIRRAAAAGIKEYWRLREQGKPHDESLASANARAIASAAKQGVSLARIALAVRPDDESPPDES